MRRGEQVQLSKDPINQLDRSNLAQHAGFVDGTATQEQPELAVAAEEPGQAPSSNGNGAKPSKQSPKKAQKGAPGMLGPGCTGHVLALCSDALCCLNTAAWIARVAHGCHTGRVDGKFFCQAVRGCICSRLCAWDNQLCSSKAMYFFTSLMWVC